MTHRERLIALVLLATAAVTAHAALTLDRSAPISIEANSAMIDEPAGRAVYSGDVVLKQGGMRLQASKLILYVKDGRAHKAIARGKPVRLEQAATADAEATQAEARQITFLITDNRMVLKNQARLSQGERLFQGAHIDYDLTNRRVSASGGGKSRVLLVLPGTADAANEDEVDVDEQDGTDEAATQAPTPPRKQ